MFKNYLKITFRNLWKNKAYAAINIGGLAIGLTGFFLLLLYINYERDYDRWSPQLKQVYQVNETNIYSLQDTKSLWKNKCDTRIGALIRNNLAGVNAVTMINPPYDAAEGIEADHKVFLENANRLRDTDSSFFKVFPYHFISGNPDHALDKVNSMVLTESLAHKWFGSTDVVGRSVKLKTWWKDPGAYFEITGVVRDLSSPTNVSFSAVYRSGENDKGSSDPNTTHVANIYVRLAPGQSLDVLSHQANKVYDNALGRLLQEQNTSFAKYAKSGKQYGIRFLPLQYVHLHPLNAKSIMDRITPSLALSVLLLMIAIINFANLATAQVVQRGKEAGVRKVLGAGKRTLIIQFLLEVAVQCIASLVIALLM
ncbi:MAG TPA: ABC transporter permease, partial [Chitinophagaceae bacterium]|nr:ABC transporter permease [Chitinophagaceae bacterium]